MNVHLVDGTYELFRAWFGAPEAQAPDGREVGATRGFLRSMASLLHEPGVTHVACAFDRTVESFRNELFDGYKTGEGLDPDLFAQFPLAERASEALGIVTWPMVQFEADDALASAAARFARIDSVERVLICSPDKDLCQCVEDDRVVTLDRRREIILDAEGVRAKFGVAPVSIPDYLALVGDAADGIPGIPRWGAKSASAVLSAFGRIEDIPEDPRAWDVGVRGAASLADNLNARREEAQLYKTLATLRRDAPVTESIDDMRWDGPDLRALKALCKELGENRVLARFG